MDVRDVWNRLGGVRKLAFDAASHSAINTGWNGTGSDSVLAERIDAVTLLFHESGTWTPTRGRQFTFDNVFRWTRDPDGRFIRLEHLRFGPDKPVFLFDLVPQSERVLASSEPHTCREDLYTARMELEPSGIRLTWTVSGPKKNERIAYSYQ